MVKIIVEGQTDKALVNNILLSLDKKENFDYEFLGLKGLPKVKNILKNITEKDLLENKYFAIVDADNSFKDRKEEFENLRNDNEIDYFIFPNNYDNGDLETLILKHIGDDKIINCFEKYQDCVGQKLDNKAKLYAYTTLKFDKRPEQYISGLKLSNDFDQLKQKLKNLFEE